ncbi:MAG: hypothetical protein LQ344_000735 [Seirophora lacunosa]|nr:MAG: hypothetical protein LQ344_000735 [Seirophora lacunosa]
MDNKPLSEYITMISNDGFEFIIKRDAANVAGTIRKMLDPTSTASYLSPSLSFAQISKRPFIYSLHLCTLPVSADMDNNNNSGVVIEKLCEYLYYNLKHKDAKDVPDMEIPPSLCLELLVAADYFDGMCVPGRPVQGEVTGFRY